MSNWTAADLAALGYAEDGRRIETRAPQSRNAAPMPVKTPAVPAAVAPAGERPAANKYHATRTVGADGRTYDSAREARWAQQLDLRRLAGDIVGWTPQPSLVVGRAENGRSIRYRGDALVIHEVLPDGRFVGSIEDVKGIDTPTSRAKRGALRLLSGIDVQVERA